MAKAPQMFRSIFPLITILFMSSISMAAINPVYKECMQRGYSLSGDSCVFPDGTACDLEQFNNGECGQEWFTDDYCIPEGEYVWDDDKCCEGLEAYLPEGVDGQASCVKTSYAEEVEEVKNEKAKKGPGYWIMLGSFILLIVLSVYLKRRRKAHAFSKQKNDEA